MRIKHTLAAFCCATTLLAQDAPKVEEPEYLGIVAVLDSNGDLQPLERQKPKHQSKETGRFLERDNNVLRHAVANPISGQPASGVRCETRYWRL